MTRTQSRWMTFAVPALAAATLLLTSADAQARSRGGDGDRNRVERTHSVDDSRNGKARSGKVRAKTKFKRQQKRVRKARAKRGVKRGVKVAFRDHQRRSVVNRRFVNQRLVRTGCDGRQARAARRW